MAAPVQKNYASPQRRTMDQKIEDVMNDYVKSAMKLLLNKMLGDITEDEYLLIRKLLVRNYVLKIKHIFGVKSPALKFPVSK
jgi:hypothetical protein